MYVSFLEKLGENTFIKVEVHHLIIIHRKKYKKNNYILTV